MPSDITRDYAFRYIQRVLHIHITHYVLLLLPSVDQTGYLKSSTDERPTLFFTQSTKIKLGVGQLVSEFGLVGSPG